LTDWGLSDIAPNWSNLGPLTGGTAKAIRVEGKDPGAYADQVEFEVRAATPGEADAFDLAVIEDGTYHESFPNLTMDPDHTRYVERIVNEERSGSVLIRAIDQLLPAAAVPAPNRIKGAWRGETGPRCAGRGLVWRGSTPADGETSAPVGRASAMPMGSFHKFW
jgi:hypothetical protein